MYQSYGAAPALFAIASNLNALFPPAVYMADESAQGSGEEIAMSELRNVTAGWYTLTDPSFESTNTSLPSRAPGAADLLEAPVAKQISRVVRIVFKTGREVVFMDAAFNEKQANTLTVYDQRSYAILADYNLHELQSWGFMEEKEAKRFPG